MEYESFKKWADENFKSRDQLMRQFFEWMTQLDDTNSALLNYEQRLQLYFYIIEFQANKLKLAGVGDYSKELNNFIKLKTINLQEIRKSDEKIIIDGMMKNANLAIRENKSKLQSAVAKNKRPKLNENKESLKNAIHTISKTHPEHKPSELWEHFKNTLGEWSHDEVELIAAKIPDQTKYRYTMANGKIASISFGQFRKMIGRIRNNGIQPG